MATIPFSVEKRVPINHEEPGFTNEDRKILYSLQALYSEFYKQFLDTRMAQERRIERLEQERAFKEDLDRMEVRLASQIADKANRTELSSAAITKTQEDVTKLATRVNWMWAYAVGAGTAVAAIFHWLVPR